MQDIIYRQAAIDVVKGIDSGFVKYIEQLPSAQSELRWIPYPKRPPKEEGEYLVTVEAFCHMRVYIASYSKNLYEVDEYDFSDEKGKAGFYGCDSEYGYYEVTDVKAWMPMMAPYEGGAE